MIGGKEAQRNLPTAEPLAASGIVAAGMIEQIQVAGYRSIRELTLPLQPINVLTGPNGCGKSNLYNSLVLIGRAVQGQFARAIAEEGGTPSVFWAGGERIRLQRRKPPKRIVLGFEADDFGYELQAGLPTPSEQMPGSLFALDPRIKEEYVRAAGTKPRAIMMKRDKPSAWLRNAEGRMVPYPFAISNSESVLSQVIEPHLYPEISAVRARILGWRFYHHFRTDAASPVRQPQIGVHTPVLSRDGSDLAAALGTIAEIGDDSLLRDTIAEALGGASVVIEADDTRLHLGLRVPGLLRPLKVQELSDGQLRFLCLCASLLSPRPPSLMALNEPESSLHPDLIDPLARLIVGVSERTQLWITTHSQALAARVEKHSGFSRMELRMVEGETKLAEG